MILLPCQFKSLLPSLILLLTLHCWLHFCFQAYLHPLLPYLLCFALLLLYALLFTCLTYIVGLESSLILRSSQLACVETFLLASTTASIYPSWLLCPWTCPTPRLLYIFLMYCSSLMSFIGDPALSFCILTLLPIFTFLLRKAVAMMIPSLLAPIALIM